MLKSLSVNYLTLVGGAPVFTIVNFFAPKILIFDLNRLCQICPMQDGCEIWNADPQILNALLILKKKSMISKKKQRVTDLDA